MGGARLMERKMATKTNTSSGCREGERKKRVEDISIALVREYLSRKVREK